MGEIPQDAVWEDLNKTQKKTVESIVDKFRPVQVEDYFKAGGGCKMPKSNGKHKSQEKHKSQNQKPERK